MSHEQLRLIAAILDGLCKFPILPYWEFGANVGKCGYCGVIGEIRNVSYIEWKHTPTCPIELIEQLKKSVTVQEVREP